MPANPQVTDEMIQRALNAQWPGKECVYADEHPSAEAGMRAALEAALADHVVVPREPVTYRWRWKVNAARWSYDELDDDLKSSAEIIVQELYAAPLPQKEG